MFLRMHSVAAYPHRQCYWVNKFRNFILVIVFWVDFEASAEISSGTPVVIFSPTTV